MRRARGHGTRPRAGATGRGAAGPGQGGRATGWGHGAGSGGAGATGPGAGDGGGRSGRWCGPPGDEQGRGSEDDEGERDWTPPVLPQRGEAVAGLAPGPENAEEQHEGGGELSGPAHAPRLPPGTAGAGAAGGRWAGAAGGRGPPG